MRFAQKAIHHRGHREHREEKAERKSVLKTDRPTFLS